MSPCTRSLSCSRRERSTDLRPPPSAGITCGLQRSFVPLKGQLVVSPQYIGFYRKAYAGADVQVRFKISDVKGATKVRQTPSFPRVVLAPQP